MPEISEELLLTSFRFFKKDGYNFIRNRCSHYNADLFQINLLVKKVICITGAEAAGLFYDENKFKRKGAIPKRVQKSLFGRKSIHTKDEEAHKDRKEMFMSVMTPENIQKLSNLVKEVLDRKIQSWQQKDRIVLFDEGREILFEAVCRWAGVPVEEDEITSRSKDMVAMIDAFGAVGPRFIRGVQARHRSEKWMEQIVRKVREGAYELSETSALYTVASYTDRNRIELDEHMAAIEVLNFIRPTVAISYYIAFAALAMIEHPNYKQKLREHETTFTELFVNEVRRYYPFAPFLGAMVKKDFDWKGYRFPENALVLLDVYGTNHDQRYLDRPEEFFPYNFKNWSKSPFDFIPSGGGDFNGHRCPGEWITIEVMKVLLGTLSALDFDVPTQELSYDLTRMPTFPPSGIVLKNIRYSKLHLEQSR